jgi:hypothetical protein
MLSGQETGTSPEAGHLYISICHSINYCEVIEGCEFVEGLDTQTQEAWGWSIDTIRMSSICPAMSGTRAIGVAMGQEQECLIGT